MRKIIAIVVALASLTLPLFGQVVWKSVGAPLEKADYTLHASRDGELYAYSTYFPAGIYRFVPTESTWSKVSSAAVGKLLVSSNDLAFALDATTKRLIRITNNFSATHKIDTQFVQSDDVYDFCVGPDTTLYAFIENAGLFRSTDLGATWHDLSSPAPSTISSGVEVGPSNTIYTWNLEAYRSTDGGATWDTVYHYHKGDRVIFCVPRDTSFYLVTANGIIYHGRDSLAHLPYPFNTGLFDNTLLDIAGNGTLFYRSHATIAFRSTDGGHRWDTLSRDGPLCIDSAGNTYCIASSSTIYASSDQGANWETMTNLTDRMRFFASGADSAIYGIAKNLLYASTNDGKTWVPEVFPNIRLIYSTSVDQNNELFVICRDSNNQVLLASKGADGLPWEFTSPLPWQDAINPYLASGRMPSGELWSVDAEGYFSLLEASGTWRNSFVLDVPGNQVYTAAAIDANTIIVTGYGVIYRSTNKGVTFKKVLDFPDETELGHAITASSTAVYVLTSEDSLYVSTDKGSTWEFFKKPTVDLLDIVASPSGTIYLSTATGVYRNLTGFNNPLVWEDISGALKGFSIKRLSLRKNKRLYAVTSGDIAFYTNFAGSAVNRRENTDLPLSVFPNPATDHCTINLPEDLHGATIECYNAGAQRVLRVPAAETLDVSHLPSGIYHLILRTKTATYTTQVVINR